MKQKRILKEREKQKYINLRLFYTSVLYKKQKKKTRDL